MEHYVTFDFDKENKPITWFQINIFMSEEILARAQELKLPRSKIISFTAKEGLNI